MARVMIRMSLHSGTKLVIMKGHNYLFNYNCMSRRAICQESIMCLICESKCRDPTRVWLTVLCPSYPSCKGEQNSAHKRRETIEGGWSNSILSFSSRTLESCLRVRATAPRRDFCQFGEKIKSNLPFSHLEVQDDPAKKKSRMQ